jgi:Hydrazine synthase alpha subunit middle domain
MNQHTTKTFGLVTLAVAAAAFGGACKSSGGGSTDPQTLPADVSAIVFLQRKPRSDTGNVFEYTSYQPGARLVKLEPPSADGKLTVLTSDPRFENADIMAYDLSFDAKAIVFSARLADSGQYQIFSMNLDGTELKQLTEGGNDYVYPMYLPGGKIFYTTNLNVEKVLDPLSNSKQFVDEYERATTAQVGTMNLDGSGKQYGPRNVSHRVSPALMPDGSVLYTEWRHMGGVNDGHLRMMNADMTGMREAFGGEDGGNGGTNSYLKARYVQSVTRKDATGNKLPDDVQVVAVSTSRDRTLQAGKLFLINLNGDEADSKFTDMTPKVPGDRVKSDVGRYYDAEIVGNANDRQFIVSWADGAVESEYIDLSGTPANFGLYLFDGKTDRKYPIFDDLNFWDVAARPIKARPEPTALTSPLAESTSTVIGALNVYDSSVLTIPKGSVAKVRLIEGFSGEEGFDMFGTTEFDGQSLYGELDLKADNSFTAKVPGNVPFHIQLIDKFAMSVANESIWISGRAGERRVCGGCHENRSTTPQLQPGQVDAFLTGGPNFDVVRSKRITPFQTGSTTAFDFSYGNIRGVPWDKAIQPILDAKCVSCHDGDASKPGNPTYTVTDNTLMGVSQTFTFDLRGNPLAITVGERMTGAYTASYISVMGLGEILGDHDVTITGDGYAQYGYVSAGSAKDSKIIEKLNPPQRFPAVDMNVRAFPTSPHVTGANELTAEEYYRLILNIDMGGQFYFRENKDTAAAYYGMGGK